MKSIVSAVLLIISLLSFPLCLSAQEVTLIATGEGATKQQAVDNALVAAVEQAYGVYVSGDTHILNDELVRDEVIQIKRGNILKYDILSENQLRSKKYSAIVEATVSVDNLLNFAKSKGSSCELSGKTLAANVALKKLYAKNGVKAMAQLYNTMGYVVPKMFDFNINLGEPIIFNTDVYVPVAVDCVFNVNYRAFADMYKTTYGHVKTSIESANVQGSIANDDLAKIENYRRLIMQLPEHWIFGFKITDNIGSEIYAVLVSENGEDFFWPRNQYIRSPKILARRSNGDLDITLNYTNPKTGEKQPLPDNHRVMYKNLVIVSHGPRIQKLDNDALCSKNRGNNLLRPFVKQAEDKYNRPRTMGHTGVYDFRNFYERMIDWSDWNNWNTARYDWTTNPKYSPGNKVCTIYFFLCYDENDIAKISDLKIKPISPKL